MLLDGRVLPWTAILPVKGLDSAKSRLASSWAHPDALALAFVEDAISALSAAVEVARIVIATSDPRVTAVARSAGCTIVDDAGHDGINAAVREAGRNCPDAGRFLVLVSDLPALDAASVDAVLSMASHHLTSFLPDAEGTGTTMWCTTDRGLLNTAFGADSARAHALAGAVNLVEASGAWQAEVFARARRDVDTNEDLDRARRLGVGPATRALLASMAARPA